ncbi:MAG TPA: hypothetical protein VJU87_02410 [Gemmatimonadaceae bacterium]|nr:hypothetical protein [Gemmatimonadaceae bacterium]
MGAARLRLLRSAWGRAGRGAALAAIGIISAACARDAAPAIGLITKTETNPYFVKMREGALAAAKAHHLTLLTGPVRTMATTPAR